MSTYHAPLAEMQFVMNELAGLAQVASLPGFEDATPDTVAAILEEAAKFATNVLDPLNVPGDREGSRAATPTAPSQTPTGFKDAYRAVLRERLERAHQEHRIRRARAAAARRRRAVEEMWHSANLAFDLCPLLTQGAIEAIELRGSQELKDTFLPKMVAGTWTGTMNLTEPQAGSDLAAVRTRAVPQGDGTYRLFGQKIFITFGEHDYTENIVHLVLARTPDAPEGVKGISLFVVPKFLVNEDGSLGARNDVHVRLARAQARHPREPHVRARVRRQGRRYGLPRRRGEPRPRVHVHHDEPRALLGRARRRGHRRARVPARRRVSRATACRAGPSASTRRRRRRRSSSTRTSAAC